MFEGLPRRLDELLCLGHAFLDFAQVLGSLLTPLLQFLHRADLGHKQVVLERVLFLGLQEFVQIGRHVIDGEGHGLLGLLFHLCSRVSRELVQKHSAEAVVQVRAAQERIVALN